MLGFFFFLQSVKTILLNSHFLEMFIQKIQEIFEEGKKSKISSGGGVRCFLNSVYEFSF